MFATRDWIRHNWTRVKDRTPTSDPQLVGTYGALADVDAELRQKMPALFAKVDRITNSGRRGYQHLGAFVCERRITECPRCGESFPAFRERDIYCSMKCSSQHRAFLKRRSRSLDTQRPAP